MERRGQPLCRLPGSGTLTITNGATVSSTNSTAYGTGTITVSNGGTGSSTTASILGYLAGSSGTVTVDGAGSKWTNGENLSVGSSGSGTLAITNGGAVSVAGTTSVGQGTGTGTINFGAHGGTLTTQSLLTSPNQLTGTGTINANGLASDVNLVFDSTHGLKQTVTLNGLPKQNVAINLDMSTPANNGSLGVGWNGNGSLTIRDGIALTCADGYLGFNSGSSGTATVDGAGSAWTNSAGLYVGYSGTGTLKITNGGAVGIGSGGSYVSYGEYAGAYLGFNSGSSGTATVDGAGSQWTNSGSLIVGENGTGRLAITGGGTVTSTGGFIGGDYPDSTGTGTVTVGGAGSKWASSGGLNVGYLGLGTLAITNGGTVTSTGGFIGSNSGSSGAATVKGAASTWTCGDYLELGGHGGQGTLYIAGGGTVTAASVSIASGSLLAVDVGRGSTMSLVGGSAWQFDSAGTIRVLAGADVGAGNTYSPISISSNTSSPISLYLGTWTDTGVDQAVGGTWNAATHQFTVSATQAGTAGTPIAIDLSQRQRVRATDSATGESMGASFLAATSSTPITFTASPVGGTTLTSLAGLLRPGESVSGVWTCSATGYPSGDPAYLSIGGPGNGGDYRNGLELWSYNSSGWTAFPASDFTYDGTYASLTVTSLGTFALTGTAVFPGDTNRDGTVDVQDLMIVLSNFGQTATTWSQGEFTGDGTVDINDLTIVLGNLSQSVGVSAGGINAVPEPSAIAIMLAGAACLFGFVCRRRGRQVDR